MFAAHLRPDSVNLPVAVGAAVFLFEPAAPCRGVRKI